jgi:hypothetical protein
MCGIAGDVFGPDFTTYPATYKAGCRGHGAGTRALAPAPWCRHQDQAVMSDAVAPAGRRRCAVPSAHFRGAKRTEKWRDLGIAPRAVSTDRVRCQWGGGAWTASTRRALRERSHPLTILRPSCRSRDTLATRRSCSPRLGEASRRTKMRSHCRDRPRPSEIPTSATVRVSSPKVRACSVLNSRPSSQGRCLVQA